MNHYILKLFSVVKARDKVALFKVQCSKFNAKADPKQLTA